MKYQKILGLVATAGLLLAGCATDSDNSNTWLSDPNAVHVSASVGSIFTRSNPAASDEAKQMSFNSGDVMGVSNNGTSLNYTFNGTDWQPGSGNYLVWDASDLKFQCWYPADGKNTFNKGYIQEDQSSKEEIAKSDYMTAATTLPKIPDSRQLDVTLVRKTARLILNIQSFNDQFDANTTKVNHIRIASKASTEASESSIVNIKPLQNGEGGIGTTYTALVIPGKVEGKLYFTTDESTETPLVVKTGTLEAGKSYTYNLIVGKNKVTIGNVTVAEWGTGKIEGGKAEEYIPYVTFTAEKPQTFKMTEYEGYKISELEYSVNNGDWTTLEAGTGVTFGGSNGNLRLRGTNLKGTSVPSQYSTITFTDRNVPVACTGDIRTLLDWNNYTTVNTENAMFIKLFENCSVLTSAPELPATSLADNCYYCMFSGCTNLKSAPELPATSLANNCYYCMFSGCTNLKSAPELPATSLANNCYYGMFSMCTNLKTAPKLPAPTLATCCYAYMFAGCTNLKTAPKLPAKFSGIDCYDCMFSGCTNLKSAELSIEFLYRGCCSYMFNDCTNLSSVTMLAPSDQISKATDCCYNWLYNAGTDKTVSSRTLKVQDKAAYEALKANASYLPTNWQIGKCTVLDKDGNAITEQ